MKLVAEILTGKLFYVGVEDDATVGDLKSKMGTQENLPADRLILILDDEYQEHIRMDRDEAPLEFYGVRDGSHIYIFFEPLVEVVPHSPPTPQYPAPSPSPASPSDRA